ncbi:MAG: ABC transporter permease [Dorea sp.]|jgi:putative ABC transport system permease protein|nr:ABC transporter permease [Dorea sp.]
MTMSNITAKLRQKNEDQYRLLGICIFLSVLLVSSFTMMFFSPAVQKFLPPGGDTRKLMWLMLGVVSIGCLIFTLYGSSLFFRKKSREFGVMLALGQEKKELSRELLREIAAVVGKYIFFGMLLAIPVSYLIWKLFQMMVISSDELQYRLGIGGVFAGIFFAAVLSLCILILGIRFIRRANIMDILNASRKTEMVKEIRPWYGKAGAALVITGLFLAMAVPGMTVRMFKQGLPGIWNATYLLALLGLYMVILSAVGHSKRGKHPEKYYNNIISANLMRFTARQTTRNMCVIALLVFVMVTSAFWGVMYYFSATEGGNDAPYDYSLHYPALEEQIGEGEIRALAEKYDTELTAYENVESLELIIVYTGRDMNDEKQYFDVEYEKRASFISASDFARISERPVHLRAGEYQTITITDFKESIWVSADCLEKIINPVTKEEIKPEFKGTAEFDNLSETVNNSSPFTFILSDEDYDKFAKDITDDWKEEHIFFNTADTMETYDFANAVKEEYISNATAISNHYSLYDAHEEELALAAGEEYGYAGKIDLSADNPRLLDEWKYSPFSKVIIKADAMELVAVFVLLSIYVSIISLTAAGIMSYIRSITIAMDNRQLFEDLKRLGADNVYEEKVIRMQLRRIFVYPVAAGCTVVGVFSLFLTYFNDMRLQIFEVKMLLMEIILMLVISGVMYGVYKMAYGRTKQIVGIIG